MSVIDLLIKKRFGGELTREEIREFVRGVTDGSVADYQASAMLMAICINGMTAEETLNLTMEMAVSGDTLDLSAIRGVKADKHSTGGVGDTTTLILAPLVAACGGKVLKMSGRGLGHTGGTIDKLESIPGMRVELPEDEFVDIVRKVGCAVVGQSKRLAPADKRLYALRDVTGTVDSVPLIASSILSKKFASGARAIVLDVKTGSGALMPTLDASINLAQAMVDIGAHAGRHITAVVSGMEEPLGSHVGNALEVKEAIDVLAGRTEGPLLDVALFLGARMLLGAQLAATHEEAEKLLRAALSSGAGLRKLKEMIQAQGGDGRVCDDTALLPRAPLIVPVRAEADGFLAHVNGTALGLAAQRMGAGRARKEDVIDPAVGFVMEKRIGDFVKQGDPIVTLHAHDASSAAQAEAAIRAALGFEQTPVPRAHLIYALVTPQGVSRIDA